MERYEAITLDVATLTDDQIIVLLESCEAGSWEIRTRDYRPTMDDSVLKHAARVDRDYRCLENGEIIAREAWRRGLLSITKGDAE